MNKSLLRILLLIFLPGAFNASATHIVGGEMNYRWLGGYYYEIRLTVYRDCINGVPPFDNPASIGIHDNQNNLINLNYNYTGFYPMGSNNYFNNATFNNQQYGYLIYPNDSQTVPHTVSSPCVIPPTNVCYRVCHYVDTVSLPPIPGGYHLVYQRCCRNFSIANIVNPLDVGATYDAWIPEAPDEDDSNPIFNAWPPTYICVNEPLFSIIRQPILKATLLFINFATRLMDLTILAGMITFAARQHRSHADRCRSRLTIHLTSIQPGRRLIRSEMFLEAFLYPLIR